MNSKQKLQATLQKVDSENMGRMLNPQMAGQILEQPQKPPTPEETIDFCNKKLQEVDLKVQQQKQIFIQEYLNTNINTAVSLVARIFEVGRVGDKNIDDVLDLALRFTLRAQERNEEFVEKLGAAFKLPTQLTDLQDILHEKIKAAEAEISEREEVKKAAALEIEKLQGENERGVGNEAAECETNAEDESLEEEQIIN